MRRISFLLDEHVAHAVARGLRRRGVEAITLTRAELLGEADEVILAWSRIHRQAIVTHDTDFLALAREGREHAGIVYAPTELGIGSLIHGLLLVHAVYTAEEMHNRVEFV